MVTGHRFSTSDVFQILPIFSDIFRYSTINCWMSGSGKYRLPSRRKRRKIVRVSLSLRFAPPPSKHFASKHKTKIPNPTKKSQIPQQVSLSLRFAPPPSKHFASKPKKSHKIPKHFISKPKKSNNLGQVQWVFFVSQNIWWFYMKCDDNLPIIWPALHNIARLWSD